MASYLSYFILKKIPVAIFFQSDSGIISKKYKVSYTPMMCVPNSHMKQVCDAVSSPFQCHITYSRAAFVILCHTAPKTIFLEWNSYILS